MIHAASVTGVIYSVTDTQSSKSCPCKQVQRHTVGTHFTAYVSYSAVNISVIARNAAGSSPAAVVSIGQIQNADLKSECMHVLVSVRVHLSCCIWTFFFLTSL